MIKELKNIRKKELYNVEQIFSVPSAKSIFLDTVDATKHHAPTHVEVLYQKSPRHNQIIQKDLEDYSVS